MIFNAVSHVIEWDWGAYTPAYGQKGANMITWETIKTFKTKRAAMAQIDMYNRTQTFEYRALSIVKKGNRFVLEGRK